MNLEHSHTPVEAADNHVGDKNIVETPHARVALILENMLGYVGHELGQLARADVNLALSELSAINSHHPEALRLLRDICYVLDHTVEVQPGSAIHHCVSKFLASLQAEQEIG